ncbi:hypothetical protein [Geoglobus acetivorans]|uniref:Uncharacterized protein n=1 Tax=Geoglobus acetivorans TaxID=565033 RepID=A0A0A7GDY1_GEOAI|nr:hypothetical protein GACE_1018 [Geoglobus acetivorans]
MLDLIFSVAFVSVKVLGVVLALLGAGYLIFDNLFLSRMGRRTAVRVVVEGRVSKREIVKAIEERGYRVVKWK